MSNSEYHHRYKVKKMKRKTEKLIAVVIGSVCVVLLLPFMLFMWVVRKVLFG